MPDQEDQQKLLQLAYLENQGAQQASTPAGPIPTLPSAPGDHTPTVKHPAFRRGQ